MKPKYKQLGYCPDCEENSAAICLYTRKRDKTKCRIKYCLNKGCGYSIDLSLPKEVAYASKCCQDS